MEVIFLYNRLLDICGRQLRALKEKNYDLMENLTAERETLTAQICSILDLQDEGLTDSLFQSKAREITHQIFDIDEEIKDILLEELFTRTEELSRIKLVE
ncbi:MAG: hypothetical protein JW814_00325 [Candidatus Krumholzibacteriota bacterium]|nr:hypothetical protein [Candidatus Krumholzibacteriota bacterium]